MWRIRVPQPIPLSRIIKTILKKDRFISVENNMEINRPVVICITRAIPIRNPKFHMKLIEVGAGKSKREVFIILYRGFIKIYFLIKMK